MFELKMKAGGDLSTDGIGDWQIFKEFVFFRLKTDVR